MSDAPTCRLSPVADWSFTQLLGRDAVKFLNNFCTADLRQIPVGQAGELMLLNAKGHVLAWGAAIRSEGGLQLMLSGMTTDEVIQHLDAYLFAEDVRLVAGGCRCWLVQPGDSVASPSSSGKTLGSRVLIDQPLPMDRPTTEMLDGSLWPTVGGAFFLLTPEGVAVNEVAQRLPALLAGAGHEPPPRVSMASNENYQFWRVENGVPRIGQDTTATSLPQELLRNAWAISFTKGCYLGQETVARLDAMGHVNWNFRTVGLAPAWPAELSLAETAAPQDVVVLVQGEQTIGQLTSVSGEVGLVRLRASVSADWAAGKIRELALGRSDGSPLPFRIVSLGD
jgi:tRNA-modifying protein YgfZ